jgi:lipoate-protein ligase A
VVVGPGTLNVTVILPESAAPGLAAVDVAHRYVLDRIAESVRKGGAPVRVLERGDLVIGDRKCAGSAQRRLKRWFLVHCSILYRFAIERVDRYLAIPARQPAYRHGRAHREFLINIGLPRHVLVEALSPPEGLLRSSPAPILAGPLQQLPNLMAEKYANPAWIERF